MRLTLSIIVLVILASCSSDPSPIGPDNLPLKYSYVVAPSCFCSQSYIGPHKLEITNGLVTNYEFLGDNGGEMIDTATINNLALSKLQAAAIKIINEKPFSQSVKYDATYNYIAKAYFDIDDRIADEEWGFTITEFEAK